MIQPESETQVLPGGPRETPEEEPAPVVRDASRPPRQVGRYELVHRLGHGGMATVHLGRAVGSAGFEKRVAIKVIHPHLSDEPDLVGMFLDEARLAAGIHHPNVVETLDLGEADGVYYTVMELVEGDTLSALSKSLHPDDIPIPVALLILSDACDGLAAAHDLSDEHGQPRGLVHRDISPQNLLITLDGWVKISDFGIAKAAGKSHNTRPGELRGKLSYMSPEQARGEAVDSRTDIFALGIVFWELLTGERLFTGKSDAVILDKVVRCEIPPVSDLRGDSLASVPAEVFEGIKRVLERTLAASPDDRYATVKEMATEVRGLRRKCAGDVEPRAWLADLMRERFGSRVDYMRAVMRESSGQTPIPAANGARRGRRRTARTGLDDVAAAARAAVADPGDHTTQLGAEARPPTGSAPALSTTASHTMPVTPVGRMRQLGTWLLLPMIGAGIAIAVMSRNVDGGQPTDVTPASVQVSPGPSKAEAAPTVQWFFSTDPDGASITIDGERQVGSTPTTITVPRQTTPVTVVFEKEGFRPAKVQLAPVSDQSNSYQLEPIPAVAPSDTEGGGTEGTGSTATTKDPKRLILRRPKGSGTKRAKKKDGEELMPMPDFDQAEDE